MHVYATRVYLRQVRLNFFSSFWYVRFQNTRDVPSPPPSSCPVSFSLLIPGSSIFILVFAFWFIYYIHQFSITISVWSAYSRGFHRCRIVFSLEDLERLESYPKSEQAEGQSYDVRPILRRQKIAFISP